MRKPQNRNLPFQVPGVAQLLFLLWHAEAHKMHQAPGGGLNIGSRVLVKEVNLGYHSKEAILFTVDLYYGNLH